jgi:hypothetical protein
LNLRRALTIICLAVIVVSGVASHLFELPFIDRKPIAMAMTAFPDRVWPDYPRFLEGVREHTKPGDTIAIIVPSMSWDGLYSYAYYRASYFLTGREVLPLITPDDTRLPQNFRRAKYVATFGVGLRTPADVIWRSGRGALLRLRR